MRKPWQWALLLIYLLAFAALLWQREYNLIQLSGGVLLIVQGGCALWQHYGGHQWQTASLGLKGGWAFLMAGLVGSGLTCYVMYAQAAERQTPTVWVRCGTDWPTVLRPASECPPEERRR